MKVITSTALQRQYLLYVFNFVMDIALRNAQNIYVVMAFRLSNTVVQQ